MDYDDLVYLVHKELLPTIEHSDDVCHAVNEWLADKNFDIHDLIIVIQYVAMDYRLVVTERNFYKRRYEHESAHDS